MFSGRFNDDAKLTYMKSVREFLDAEGVPTYMVEPTGGGDSFGDKTVDGLHRAKALLVFGTEDYGAKTGAQYETFRELEYAHQNELMIIPLKLGQTYPPRPDGDTGPGGSCQK